MGVWIETVMTNELPQTCQVTPFVGVWIETILTYGSYFRMYVTPFVGVWIETDYKKKFNDLYKSHPSWVCGLKQPEFDRLGHQPVTPFVGVWIETIIISRSIKRSASHTLRGCVD